MKATLLEFDDAGASDEEPVKGITMGHIRHWYDECVAMEERNSQPETKHYLGSIRRKLERLYDVYPNDPILRGQISDEVDWIDKQLAL